MANSSPSGVHKALNCPYGIRCWAVGDPKSRPQNLEGKVGVLIFPVGSPYNDQVVVVVNYSILKEKPLREKGKPLGDQRRAGLAGQKSHVLPQER